jgi:hypothetical protein
MVYEVPKELGTVLWSSQKIRGKKMVYEVPKELGSFLWSPHKNVRNVAWNSPKI